MPFFHKRSKRKPLKRPPDADDNTDVVSPVEVPRIDGETRYKVKQYKGKGSKSKEIVLSDEGVRDEKNRMLVKYGEIEQLRLGKTTDALRTRRSSVSVLHSMFFSITSVS